MNGGKAAVVTARPNRGVPAFGGNAGWHLRGFAEVSHVPGLFAEKKAKLKPKK